MHDSDEKNISTQEIPYSEFQSLSEKQFIVLNQHTGEYKLTNRVLTDDELERVRKYKENEEEMNQYKQYMCCDHFVMYLFTKFQNLTDLKPAMAIRMVYLQTFFGYNFSTFGYNSKTLSKKKIKEIMNLKDRTFTEFFRAVTEAQYLLKKGKEYELNSEKFIKGKLTFEEQITDVRYVKVYIDSLRKLYLSVPQKKHVYLGYVFQVIPYVNRQWNIVCKNPLETNIDLVEPFTAGEFCELIGYDKSQFARLNKVYKDIKFEYKDTQQMFLAYVTTPAFDDPRIFINPNIFYAGNDFQKVEILKIMFNHKKTDKSQETIQSQDGILIEENK